MTRINESRATTAFGSALSQRQPLFRDGSSMRRLSSGINFSLRSSSRRALSPQPGSGAFPEPLVIPRCPRSPADSSPEPSVRGQSPELLMDRQSPKAGPSNRDLKAAAASIRPRPAIFRGVSISENVRFVTAEEPSPREASGSPTQSRGGFRALSR